MISNLKSDFDPLFNLYDVSFTKFMSMKTFSEKKFGLHQSMFE